jgi:hypothetical protein
MQQRGEIRRETLISPDRIRWVASGDFPDLFPEQFFDRQLPTTANEMQWHYVSEGRRLARKRNSTHQSWCVQGTTARNAVDEAELLYSGRSRTAGCHRAR